MSVESARGLLLKLQDDADFCARLEAAPHDQKRSIVAEAGFGDVKLRDVSAVLPESLGGEIADEDLETVAGGIDPPTSAGMSAVTGAAASMSIVVVAVAAAL